MLMLCERPGRGKRAVDSVVGRGNQPRRDAKKKRPGRRCPGRLEEGVSELLLASVEKEFLSAYDLAVQGAGNERLAIGFAGLGVGNSNLIDFQRTPDSALVIGLGFGEVGQGAEFRALGVDEVALRLND